MYGIKFSLLPFFVIFEKIKGFQFSAVRQNQMNFTVCHVTIEGAVLLVQMIPPCPMAAEE